MKTPIRPKLKDLKVGDQFYTIIKGKPDKKFKVIGRIKFNIGFGSASRKCKNLTTGKEENKSCRQEVIKIYHCLDCGTQVPVGEKYCSVCEFEDDQFI